jgi:hypothetical protein
MQWRANASVLNRVLAFASEAGTSTIAAAQALPSAVLALPTSTQVTGSVAVLLALALALVLSFRRPSEAGLANTLAHRGPERLVATESRSMTTIERSTSGHHVYAAEEPLTLLPDWAEPVPGVLALDGGSPIAPEHLSPNRRLSIDSLDAEVPSVTTSSYASPSANHAQPSIPAAPTAIARSTAPAIPSARTAYILNLVLPGAGNILIGQTIIGIILILGILLGWFLFFFGTGAAMIGMMIILVSAVAAIFTLGLSLIIGLPIGMIFLLMGAGPIVAFIIWIFSLIVSEILVHSKISRLAEQSALPAAV